MSSSEIDRVFEPFAQAEGGRQAGGTGLGLSISSRLVSALGGALSVRSEPGVGSCFEFDLPFEEVEIALQPDTDPLDEDVLLRVPEGRAVTVLVADDSDHNRSILVRLLAAVGIDAVLATNGRDALSVLASQSVDLVLMDVRMPIMNGLEATRSIRADAALRATKIIAVSASVFSNQRQRIVEAGCDDFIAKPLRAAELYSKLATHLSLELARPEPNDAAQRSDEAGESLCAPEVLVALRDAAAVGDVDALRSVIRSEAKAKPMCTLLNELDAAAREFDMARIHSLLATQEETR